MLRSFFRNLYSHVVNIVRRLRFFLSAVLTGWVLFGCAGVSDLQLLQSNRHRDVPPEFRQKVGVYVHEKAEHFNYYGSASQDVSDLMSFHLQQVLPYNIQTSLQGVFALVDMAEPGPKIEFKVPDLVGYFEIKVTNVRYDYPETGRPVYRAETSLLVEFKTMQNQVIWSRIFQGEGTGFSDSNISLTDFGKGASSALEDAFQRAIDDMEDAVVQSPSLKEYLRLRAGQGNQANTKASDQGQRLTG